MSAVAGRDLRGAWLPLTQDAVEAAPGCPGVYQLADHQGLPFRIGYAGGKSLFGLRGELARLIAENAGREVRFRMEVNMQYISRWKELMMVHRALYGEIPVGNPKSDAEHLGFLGGRHAGVAR